MTVDYHLWVSAKSIQAIYKNGTLEDIVVVVGLLTRGSKQNAIQKVTNFYTSQIYM